MKIVAFTLENPKYAYLQPPEEDYFLFKEKNNEAQKRKTSWIDPAWRAYARKNYRNNPQEKHSYGGFTGEATSPHYLRTGSLTLERGDYIIAYSEGMLPLLTPAKACVSNFLNLEKYLEKHAQNIAGSETTLIAVHWSV